MEPKCTLCKKPTTHASGICFSCRKKPCKRCGKKIAPMSYMTDICGECRQPPSKDNRNAVINGVNI